MRTRTIIATSGAVIIAAALSLTVVACSDTTDQDCKLNTLELQVQLDLTTSLADTITVISYAPPFQQSFTRKPDGVYGELDNIDVTFDAGKYPSDKLLTLLVRASAQGQTIGEAIEQIHLLPGCTVGGATVAPMTIDAAPTITDGGTD